MSKKFKLQTEYQPAGDQPTAIKSLVDGLNDGHASDIVRCDGLR